MTSRWVDWLTQVAVGAAGAAAATCVIVAVLHPVTPWSVVMSLAAVAYLSVPLVGAAMVRAERRNGVGWLLLASGIGFPVAASGYLIAEAATNAGGPAGWAGWWDGWPWVFALGLPSTAGLLLFPDGRPPSRRWWPVVVLTLAQELALLVGLLFAPGMLDYPDQPNPTALPGRWGAVADGLVGTILLVAPLATLGAWSLHGRARRELDPARARALRRVAPAAWLVAGSWWACIVIVLGAGGAEVGALPFQLAGMLTLAAAAWTAIRRYGLFDGRRVVNQALVYAALSTFVVVVYLAVASVVRAVVSQQIGAAVAVAVALLVALPLRDVLQRAANRLVYGYQDDPYGALVRLGRRLEVAAAADDVLPSVAATVRAALRLPYVAIRLAGTVVAADGTARSRGAEEFPLVFAGETIGDLVAEPRDGEFTATERRLLAGILGQVAAAGHAVALTGDLRRSRERVVAAAEEERRRLRRDLHDGLGPALASVVLGLQRARRRVDSDPAAAAQQLDTLTGQTQAAVADVRRLVYGLRPPALDELGLVGALTEHASALGAIDVEGPDREPVLPAAVEVAAYRIALEAMTNTVRHAGARQTTVRVSVDGMLRIEIADNGRGMPAGYRAGVGITSMRERAVELGGTCVIEPRTPRGTVVRVALPLEVL
ncbi:sensor histidine kinase [Dactylosporangium aurantiacum]|uniref:histidine kinase n=1 Tax=Dactylosporangium aurantiacum TaxID=35754 RepID=A0A9Q9IMR6_9ACTN|nr:sensor histidine kinase [Dactylosporangium aurantiacum]MDG6110491.1 sensor histidine kinase [Dactylosporangium aurantiacum]UWZ58381.1 sensor histidine kinase [Dactylosporangium aurantiacum]